MGSAISLEIFKELYEMAFGRIDDDDPIQHDLTNVIVDEKFTPNRTTVRARTHGSGTGLSSEPLNLTCV